MAKIDRLQLIEAATTIIAAEGEHALTMRRLATRLHVTAMALYRHFEDRDALLLAVVERVSEDISFPAPSADPEEDASRLALLLHGFLTQHPWMIRLISTGRLASPAGLRFPEGFIDAALRAGRTDDEAFLFYRIMFATILGQATFTDSRRSSPEGVVLPPHPASGLPAVERLGPRWRELDDAAAPETLFRSIAATLRT